MANEVEIRVTADTKKAERGLQGLRGSLDRFSRQARVAGAALTAFGVVGAVGLKKLVDSAKEQEIGINKLNQALRNVGQTYASNQTAIEGVIDSIQRKTNFGDEEQRESLRTLITIGGKYEGSLVALRVATDMAAGADMSLAGASLLLGKAIAGETSALGRYGIKLAEGATQTEIMTALTKQFGGMAEAAADPLTQLGNRMGDVGQKVGEFFIPLVDKAAIGMEKLATKLTEADPAMVRMVALFAGLSVGLALTVGPLLLMVGFLPFIAKGFAFLGLALIPVAKALLLVGGLVAAGIVLWRNWDHVTSFLSKVFESNFFWLVPGGPLIKAIVFLVKNWDTAWEHIKNMFVDVVKEILFWYDTLANAFITIRNFIVKEGQKAHIEMFEGFAIIPKIKTDFKEFSATVKSGFESMGKSGEEQGGKLWESFKGGMGSTFQELRTLLGGWLDDMGLGVEDFETKMAEVNEAIDTMFGTDAPEAIDKTTDAMNKATNAVRSFNDLVLAGQFKSRVRGGTPEVVTYGTSGATAQKLPGPHLLAVEQLLLAVAGDPSPGSRKKRLQDMSGWIAPHEDALTKSGLLAHIRQDKVFTLEEMLAYEKTYKAMMRKREGDLRAQEGTPWSAAEKAAFPFAHGGIVTRPTLGLLGEAGPEAVVPLGGGRGLAPVYNITISNNTVFGEMDFKRLVVKAVTDSHRRGGLPFLGKA